MKSLDYTVVQHDQQYMQDRLVPSAKCVQLYVQGTVIVHTVLQPTVRKFANPKTEGTPLLANCYCNFSPREGFRNTFCCF